MKPLSLPALPTTTDHAAFMAECDAAIRDLNQGASNARHDLDAAVSQHLPKAAAVLRAELATIEDRKREFVVARLRAVVDGKTKEAEGLESDAVAALPIFEAAQAELKAAEDTLRTAQRAYRWPADRAEAARGVAARAAAELADLTRKPSRHTPEGSRGMGATSTTERELALLGRH